MSDTEPPAGQPPAGQPPTGQPLLPSGPPTSWLPPAGQPPPASGPQTSWQPSTGQLPPAAQPGPGRYSGQYPQQTLQQQEVHQGRSRKPLLIGLLIVLVLVAGGIVAWQLLKSDGEDTRAAYCSALRKLTNNGDIATALSGADASTLQGLNTLQRLAPDAVRSDWDTLQSLAQAAQQGNVDYSAALKALSSLTAISDDARSKCGITMNVPGLP